MMGNRLIKGHDEQTLVSGLCEFQKIQLKEVTSHFSKGWVYLVVLPQARRNDVPHGDKAVSPDSIRPLVIEKVVVRAKKAVTKDEHREPTL